MNTEEQENTELWVITEQGNSEVREVDTLNNGSKMINPIKPSRTNEPAKPLKPNETNRTAKPFEHELTEDD